jgi:predicted HTH domain antitoxin
MDVMRVTIQLPDDISAALEERWDDVPRRSLEAIAIEAYRSGALGESQVRRLLGLESRFQVHALLKERNVALQYTAADLEDDLQANESSEFCPADDRRGGQRAAALSDPARTHRTSPAVLRPRPRAGACRR